MSQAALEPEPEAVPAQQTVLVVDDISMFRDLLANFLTRLGRVIQAGDGAEALELARRERPRLIVSDLEMPGTNGAALCRAVREDPALAGTHFVMILPDGNARDRVRAIRAGADDVLSKPLQRVDLLGTARRFLSESTVRGLPRVQVETPVTIYLAKSRARAKALNLSRGGMFVRTDLPLPTRSEWRLRFPLPETHAQLTPTAMVVWRADERSPSGPGLGMRFVELDGRSARELDDFVYERTPTSSLAPRPLGD
jgi:uncharacterized protein (TIGR02266 family)